MVAHLSQLSYDVICFGFCCQEANVIKLADASPIRCFKEPNVTSLEVMDASRIGCLQAPDLIKLAEIEIRVWQQCFRHVQEAAHAVLPLNPRKPRFWRLPELCVLSGVACDLVTTNNKEQEQSSLAFRQKLWHTSRSRASYK